MPTPYSNFSTPDDGSAPAPSAVGSPGAANGATWDPVNQRWVNSPGATAPPRPAGSTWDQANKGWDPASTGPDVGNDTNSQGGESGAPAAQGRVMGAGAWGGYAGTNVLNPDGSLSYDQSLNGANADTTRYQGMGAAAAGQAAYQNDYTNANADATNAQGARIDQGNALGLARNQALYGSAQSTALGQHMLQNGAQTQQAAALSTRGGGLAQAAALHQQQAGQASYMQQGNNAIAAQQADDMAAGRQLYQNQAGAMRAGDATAQGLHQEQATAQMNNELGQRQLNDQTQQGYEGLAQGVQTQQQQGALHSEGTDSKIAATANGVNQAGADRAATFQGAAIGTVGSVIGAMGKAGSDERMKQNARPMNLAMAAMQRKAGY